MCQGVYGEGVGGGGGEGGKRGCGWEGVEKAGDSICMSEKLSAVHSGS